MLLLNDAVACVFLLLPILCGGFMERRYSCGGLCKCEDVTISCEKRNQTDVPFFPLAAEIIFLQNNSILEIQDDTFEGLTHLKILDLSRNAITRVPKAAFDSLIQLTELDLSNNKITELPSRMLFPSSIRLLYLQNNDISVILDFTFQNLENLKELHLESNRIHTVEKYGFAGLGIVLGLFLADNKLSNLSPQVFEYQKCVQVIDLSHNNFTKVPNFASLLNLKVLNVSNNSLTSAHLGSAFANMRKLETIDFSYNNISVIPVYAFRAVYSTLKNLNLSSSNIRVIETSALYISSLENLDISLNAHILDLPESLLILGKTNIEELNLSKAGITSVEALHKLFHLTQMDELKSLNLSGNNISSITSDVFDGMRMLTYLDLSNNGLQSVDGTTKNSFANLLRLNLSGNNLTQIPLLSQEKCEKYYNENQNMRSQATNEWSENGKEFAKVLVSTKWCSFMKSLVSLDLSANSIQYLTVSEVSKLQSHPHLIHVDISRNPFQCSCQFAPLCEALNSDSLYFDGLSDWSLYHCYPPDQNTSVLDYCAEVEQCEVFESSQHISSRFIALGCGVTVVAIFIAAGLVLCRFGYCQSGSSKTPKAAKCRELSCSNYSEVNQTRGSDVEQNTLDTHVDFEDSYSSSTSNSDDSRSDISTSC